MVNGRKDKLLVLETSKARQLSPINEVAEKSLRRVVRSDSGWHDYSCVPFRCQQVADGFGKDRVGVDVACGGEWIAVALAKELADTVGGVYGGDELGMQGGIFLKQLCD